MRRRCPHRECPKLFWSADSLGRHLVVAHGYSNSQRIEAVWPGHLERQGAPRPEMPYGYLDEPPPSAGDILLRIGEVE